MRPKEESSKQALHVHECTESFISLMGVLVVDQVCVGDVVHDISRLSQALAKMPDAENKFKLKGQLLVWSARLAEMPTRAEVSPADLASVKTQVISGYAYFREIQEQGILECTEAFFAVMDILVLGQARIGDLVPDLGRLTRALGSVRGLGHGLKFREQLANWCQRLVDMEACAALCPEDFEKLKTLVQLGYEDYRAVLERNQPSRLSE